MESVLLALFLIVVISLLLFLATISYDEDIIYTDEELSKNPPKTHWKLINQHKHLFSGFKRKKKKKVEKIHDKEILKVLLGFDDEKLNELFQLYKKHFGKGAARYARKTYQKWESGEVKPISRTFTRFLLLLPSVMSFDMKTELLRRLMEAYCKKDSYDLTIYTDNWEKTLEPLVKQVIDKPYNAMLPKQIEDRLIWLAHDDMDAARKILAESKVQEGKIAVSMLREEFENIEHLLENTKGKRKVMHKLKFPYGTINLKIKKRYFSNKR